VKILFRLHKEKTNLQALGIEHQTVEKASSLRQQLSAPKKYSPNEYAGQIISSLAKLKHGQYSQKAKRYLKIIELIPEHKFQKLINCTFT
jgi:hypothetical protein